MPRTRQLAVGEGNGRRRAKHSGGAARVNMNYECSSVEEEIVIVYSVSFDAPFWRPVTR